MEGKHRPGAGLAASALGLGPGAAYGLAVTVVTAGALLRLLLSDLLDQRATFNIVVREAALRRNPRTGEAVQVTERRSVRWRTGKALHASLQEVG